MAGQASRSSPSLSITVMSAGTREGEEKDGPSGLSGSHTNCFQPRGDREERTVQTNGPKDALILFRANLLSRSWQAASKHASRRAPRHAASSLSPTTQNYKIVLRFKSASSPLFLIAEDIHSILVNTDKLKTRVRERKQNSLQSY